MAVNMTALINQELEKLEKRDIKAGRSADPFMSAFKDTWQMGQQQREWNERKNAQMQKMLDIHAEGYKTSFNATDTDKYYDRVDSYISKNSGSMNDITLEYADALKRNIGDHRDKVVKFKEDVNMFEASKDEWMLKADDYFARGEALEDTDYGDIQDSIDDYVRMKNEIIENNAEFLQLPQFKHVYTNMVGQEAVINDLLTEAKDQQVFTKYEYDYLTRAMQTGNYQIIEEERAKKKALQGVYAEEQVSDIKPAYDKNELYRLLDEGKTITVPEGMQILGAQEGETLSRGMFEDLDISEELFEEELENAETELNRINSIFKTRTGEDYIVERRGGTPIKYTPSNKEMEILKDHFGFLDSDVEGMSNKQVSNKMDEYQKETNIDPNTGETIEDDSAWPEIFSLSAIGYGIGRATGANEKIAEASKMMLDETIKGGKYIKHIAKNVDVNDITHFLDDKVVQGAVEDLDGLKDAMEKAKEQGEYSKAYKEATNKYNKKVKQHAKALKSAGKIKLEGKQGVGKTLNRAIKSMTQTELEQLLRNPNKWNTLKAKRFMMKTVPGLGKGLRQFVPGGGFASFELGRRATKELVEHFTGEGIVAEGAGIGGGLLAQKKIYNAAKKKITEKIAAKGGKQWLVKTIAKKLGTKVAIGLTTGVTAGGGTPLSIATGTLGTLAGLGMGILDVMELFELGPYSKEEEGEE